MLKQVSSTLVLPLVILFVATGCSGQVDGSQATKSKRSVKSLQAGTNGILTPIQSDNLRAAGYDELSMVMTVQFDNGYLYEYYGVSAELWNSFVAAQPNPWSLVGYPQLVQAGIPYKRVG